MTKCLELRERYYTLIMVTNFFTIYSRFSRWRNERVITIGELTDDFNPETIRRVFLAFLKYIYKKEKVLRKLSYSIFFAFLS